MQMKRYAIHDKRCTINKLTIQQNQRPSLIPYVISRPSASGRKTSIMRYLIVSGLAAVLMLAGFRSRQEFMVKGFITDSRSNTPIAGATVRIKGEPSGIVSGSDGGYAIAVPGEPAVLQFSAAGYETRELRVDKNKMRLDVKLKKAETDLDEVVVVSGYGMKKEEAERAVAYAPGNLSRGQVLRGRASGIELKQYSPRNHYPAAVSSTDSTADFNTESYDEIVENRFLEAMTNPLSTFSIDVDAAAYSNVRRFLQSGQLPPEGAVRIEELINYFHYDYPQPEGRDPFSISTEMADCPWSPQHKLVMIGLQGRRIPTESLPASNLVFLIDVSGSMLEPDKLPLVQASMKLLVDQLREQDRVALVVYAGNAGLVMPSTSGSHKQKIKDAIDRLEAGGSTAGGAGIRLAYQVAKENFIAGGNNRVILCTDGDFNVGVSSDSELGKLIEEKRKTGIFLTVLGYGTGNYQDSKMQKLADKGNGNHAYIDNINEARKVLVNEFGGTLFTIAKDVKLQLEFNPAKVQAYRLIGYENRMLNKEDFNNDAKDAGELGSGHTVTALYEIIPVGVKNEFAEKTDPLKYQQKDRLTAAAGGQEIMTIKFRYKEPDGEVSRLIVHPVADGPADLHRSSANFRFAAAVAQFGMLLRHSEFKQQSDYEQAFMLAKGALGLDEEGYRAEFLGLLKKAEKLSKRGG
jgi:Ca-activated chloride channel family protein